MTSMPPPDAVVDELIRRALEEDLGRAGDLTSNTVIPADLVASGRIVARAAGVIAGLDIAGRVFTTLDSGITVRTEIADGDRVDAATVLATMSGPARGLLTGERTALNILGHLSGIATQVAAVVELVRGTGVRVADTRKTTPGLRSLEKYAVRCGGGTNHRFGLDDAVMIKDNHIAAVGSITTAVAAARTAVGHVVTIEVEVDRLDQLAEAIDAGADIVLLDNMSLDELASAVEAGRGRCVLEASGAIAPEAALDVAKTGVDVVSIGRLTHSAPSLDVAFDLDAPGPNG
jgi:nicotinate-nucleotide pyrophosphorylase (carboxylating)